MKNIKSLLSILLVSIAIPSLCAIISGLEWYGDLELADQIECASDSTHSFRQYPAGAAFTTNILGSTCIAMRHPTNTSAGKERCGYLSWRLCPNGAEPGAMYLMVVDYPDDAPRAATIMNYGTGSRRGFHTGFTVGDAISPKYVTPYPESINIALSGEYRTLEQLMVLGDKPQSYNGSGRINASTDGFDISFMLFPTADAPDSDGVAIKSIRLYKVLNEPGLKAQIPYPVAGLPRRIVTWREEMSDTDVFTNKIDNYRARSRLMNSLGINTFSKTMLEFGYVKNWDPNGGSAYNYGTWWAMSGGATDWWSDIVRIMSEDGHQLLPFYEYAGGRGGGGLGYASNSDTGKTHGKCTPLYYDTKNNWFVQSGNGIAGAMVDITSPEARAEFKKMLDCTIIRYKDYGNILGAWLRNRGSMPVSFHSETVARFNAETGRTGANAVTRANIAAAITDSQIYKLGFKDLKPSQNIYHEYLAWWYSKRKEFLDEMHDYLETNGVPVPKLIYSGDAAGEAGASYNDWVTQYYKAADNNAWKARTGESTRGLGEMYGYYWNNAVTKPDISWGSYEHYHSNIGDDPWSYTNSVGVALAYPFIRTYNVIGNDPSTYRNASGDLPFVRFYHLNENMGFDDSDKNLGGYFTSDMDHTGRGAFYKELWSMSLHDPTMLGYLCGSNFARNDTPTAREFFLNFLALPAIKSEIVKGGWWGCTYYTFRRYNTGIPGVGYWAIINQTQNEYTEANNRAEEFQFLLPDGTVPSKIYECVSGKVYNLPGNGKVRIDVEPLSLKAFSTEPPSAPSFNVDASIVSDTSATVSVSLSSMGAASSASLQLTLAPADGSAAAISRSCQFTAAGQVQDFDFTGLIPSTQYIVLATLSAENIDNISRRAVFTTQAPLAAPRGEASVNADLHSISIPLTVTSLGQGAAWTDVSATITGGNAPSELILDRLLELGSFEFTIGALYSDTEYTVEITLQNDLGYTLPLGTFEVTTSALNLPVRAIIGSGVHIAHGVLQVPVAIDVCDPDSVATVYVMNGRPSGALSAATWTASAAVPAMASGLPTDATIALSDFSPTPGATITLAALLQNTRMGIAEWSDAVEWTIPTEDSSAPVTTLEISQVGYTDAEFSARLVYLGDDAQSAALTLRIVPTTGGDTLEYALGSYTTATSTSFRTPKDLIDGVAYTATIIAVNNGDFSSTSAPVSFSTTPLEVPTINLPAVNAASYSATASVAVSAMGAGNESLTIEATATDSNNAVVWSQSQTITSAGTIDFALPDLASSTQYSISYRVVSTTGRELATGNAQFTTLPDPFSIKAHSALLSKDAATVRISALVDVFSETPNKAKLYVNETLVREWNSNITDGSELVHTMTAEPDADYIFTFIASAPSGLTAMASGTFASIVGKDWFDVDFARDGYNQGVNWDAGLTAEDMSGNWIRIEGSSVSENAGLESLTLAAKEANTADYVRFIPQSTSKENCDATISMRLQIQPATELAIPEGSNGAKMLLQSVFDEDATTTTAAKLAIWNGSAWNTLEGVALDAGTWIDVALDFNLAGDSPAVRVRIGETSLYRTADKSVWTPIANTTTISEVGFSGSYTTKIAAFSGFYREKVQTLITLEVPQLGEGSDGSTALGFRADGNGNEYFCVNVVNPIPGAYYTAFVADTLDSDTWLAAADSITPPDSATTIRLEALVDSAPSKFLRVVVSTTPFAAGDPLPAMDN